MGDPAGPGRVRVRTPSGPFPAASPCDHRSVKGRDRSRDRHRTGGGGLRRPYLPYQGASSSRRWRSFPDSVWGLQAGAGGVCVDLADSWQEGHGEKRWHHQLQRWLRLRSLARSDRFGILHRCTTCPTTPSTPMADAVRFDANVLEGIPVPRTGVEKLKLFFSGSCDEGTPRST